MARRKLVWFLIALIGSAMITNLGSANTLLVVVTTDKPCYAIRNTVHVNGTVRYNGEPVDRGLVGIQIEHAIGDLVVRTVPTGTNFSERWPVEVLSVTPCDQLGNPKQDFRRGHLAYFKAEVRNNDPFERDVTITINVYDSNLVPLGVIADQRTMRPDCTGSFLGSMPITEWASLGNAPVYANVYEAWPKNDGRPYCPEKMANFTIIEPGKEPPNNPIPEQPVQNGSYDIQFQLPPEPLPVTYPATYDVAVSCWYSGQQDSAKTTFQVWIPGDVDRDGDVDIYDIVKIGVAYGSEEGDENWLPEADFAEPYGKINIYDLVLACVYYGTGR